MPLPRGSKYPIFKDSGPKYHEGGMVLGTRILKCCVLGPSGLLIVFRTGLAQVAACLSLAAQGTHYLLRKRTHLQVLDSYYVSSPAKYGSQNRLQDTSKR